MIEAVDEMLLDGCAINRPATVQSAAATKGALLIAPGAVVDVEVALQWALAQTRYLPWRGVHDRELMLDGGYTVIPKGSDRRYHGRGLQLQAALDVDAATILAALDRLDVWTRSLVTANAKAGRRPDWMAGVEPKLIEKRVYNVPAGKRRHKRKRKSHHVSVVMVWDVDPQTIRACREIYARWHAGMTRLVMPVSAVVRGFHINGFDAPAAPWEQALEEIA